MALIKCPDCSTEVSDAATACLKCGRPMNAVTALAPEKVSSQGSNAFVFAAIGFGLGFCLLWGGCGNFQENLGSGSILVYSIGGGIVALLGGILGAVLGKK